MPLGAVCDLVPRVPSDYSGVSPYYATGSVTSEGLLHSPQFVEFNLRPSRANCMPEVGDIGFAKMKGTTKVLKISCDKGKALFSTGFFFLKPKNMLDQNYLYYYLLSDIFQKEKDLKSGDGIMGGIKTGDVLSIQIPIPPLDKQKEISKKLDYAFEDILTAQKNYQKNLANANEINLTLLDGLINKKGKNLVKLGSMIEVLTDYHANGSYEVLKKNVNLSSAKDYAWMVRSTDFENDFMNDLRYISESAYNFLSKSKVFSGDLIMSKIGNAGKVYLMPDTQGPCSLAMNLFLIRINPTVGNNKFIYYFLKSYEGQRQITASLKGAATKTITKDSVKNILIPNFSKIEQEELTQKLEDLMNETRSLKGQYISKIDKLSSLKSEILNSFFIQIANAT